MRHIKKLVKNLIFQPNSEIILEFQNMLKKHFINLNYITMDFCQTTQSE